MSKPLNDRRFQQFGAIVVLPSKTIPQKKGCQGFSRPTFPCPYGVFFCQRLPANCPPQEISSSDEDVPLLCCFRPCLLRTLASPSP